MESLHCPSKTPCEQHAAELCDALGVYGPLAFGALLVAAREWWKRRGAEKERERIKQDRNAHATRAQDYAIKIASLRPPGVPLEALLEVKSIPPEAVEDDAPTVRPLPPRKPPTGAA